MILTLKKNSARNYYIGLVRSTNPARDAANAYTDELVNGNVLVYCGVTGNFNKELYKLIVQQGLLVDSLKKTTTFEDNTHEKTEYYYEVKATLFNLLIVPNRNVYK